MRVLKPKLLILSVIFVIFSLFFGSQANIKAQTENELHEGRVVEIIQEYFIEEAGRRNLYQEIRLLATSGSLEGSELIVENGGPITTSIGRFDIGDKVVFMQIPTYEGESTYIITDFVRREGLLALFILFVVVVVAIGKWWGISSLLGMAFSFIVIFKFILPMIVKGYDAVLIAIIGSAFIIPVTFSLSHGLNRKTLIAVAGTLITLIITGSLAVFFVDLTNLTGFSTDEANFLQFELGERINMKGILLAGIIIASLGILDDITISQASIVRELKSANKKLTQNELFKKAMNVGTDHIASLVNTLILVYTGASLPLLLLFITGTSPFSEVINYEMIADEVVKTLVGSIGLVLAVPITTLIAVKFSR